MSIDFLIEAANDLNAILFDPEQKEEGWINTESSFAELEAGIKESSLWLLPSDHLEDITIEVLLNLNWREEDFSNLAESQNPIPAFMKLGIELPMDKDTKKKKPKKVKKPDPEPVVDEEAAVEYTDKPPPTAKKVIPPSAYGTAIAVMFTDPTIPLSTLYAVMHKKGFNLRKTGNSIKTAHSIFKKIFTGLVRQGYKKEFKG